MLQISHPCYPIAAAATGRIAVQEQSRLVPDRRACARGKPPSLREIERALNTVLSLLDEAKLPVPAVYVQMAVDSIESRAQRAAIRRNELR